MVDSFRTPLNNLQGWLTAHDSKEDNLGPIKYYFYIQVFYSEHYTAYHIALHYADVFQLKTILSMTYYFYKQWKDSA